MLILLYNCKWLELELEYLAKFLCVVDDDPILLYTHIIHCLENNY